MTVDTHLYLLCGWISLMLSCIADVLYACVIGPSFISFPEVEITVIVIVRLLLSMWFYNSEYGDAHMRGWLFRQGSWSWGCVITWHIVDLGVLDSILWTLHVPQYFWTAYLWKWSSGTGWQCDLLLSDGSVQRSDVEPWMVHSLM